MDLSTIQAKLFKYRSFRDFDADVTLMCENCHQYNGIGSYYSGVIGILILNTTYASSMYQILHEIYDNNECIYDVTIFI